MSEIAALQRDDFDFRKHPLLVHRSFVSGRVDDAKTECSPDYVPLHPSLTGIVLDWSLPTPIRTGRITPRRFRSGIFVRLAVVSKPVRRAEPPLGSGADRTSPHRTGLGC